eukprot:SAG22_NODE_7_length_40155_cov_25.241356_35_plen_289_part_00
MTSIPGWPCRDTCRSVRRITQEACFAVDWVCQIAEALVLRVPRTRACVHIADRLDCHSRQLAATGGRAYAGGAPRDTAHAARCAWQLRFCRPRRGGSVCDHHNLQRFPLVLCQRQRRHIATRLRIARSIFRSVKRRPRCRCPCPADLLHRVGNRQPPPNCRRRAWAWAHRARARRWRRRRRRRRRRPWRQWRRRGRLSLPAVLHWVFAEPTLSGKREVRGHIGKLGTVRAPETLQASLLRAMLPRAGAEPVHRVGAGAEVRNNSAATLLLQRRRVGGDAGQAALVARK